MTDSSRSRKGARTRAGIAATLLAAVIAGVALLATRVGEGPVDDPLPAELRAYAEQGPLRIGWFRGAEPVSIWDGDEVTGGYAIEQWRLIAIRLGLDLEHVVYEDIPSVVEALRSGDIDIAGTQGDRPDLLEFAGSTEPLAWERITFVGAPEQVGRGDDLTGRRVTTVAGSPLEQILTARFPEAEYVTTATIPEGFAATAAGDIDLYLAPLAVVGYATNQLGLQLVPIGENVQIIPISAWAREGSPALELIRYGRAQLTDEEIALITARWAGFDLGPPNRGTPAWLVQSLLGALALALVLGAFALLLRRRVRAATDELVTLNAELEERVDTRTRELAAAVAQLEVSNKALGRFAHTVAHDLRGPVTAIHGLSSLLAEGGFDDEQRTKMGRTIMDSSHRLAELIRTLLADAEEAGAPGADFTGADFVTWLRGVVAAEVESTGAELDVVSLDGDIDLDGAMLRRVAVNLVGNALKYGGAGDRPPTVRASLDHVDGRWRLVVEDDGDGIPLEQRDAVFESGTRLVDDDDGHGLGLADAKALVVQAGGTIELQESATGGARFVVDLPGRVPAAGQGHEGDPGTSGVE